MSKYSKNISKEEFIEKTIKTRDALAHLREILENTTITSVENDGTFYKITFKLARHYEKAPTFLNTNAENSEVIQDYINTLRRNITENITGIVWVNNESLPVKFVIKKHAIETYLVTNITVESYVEYNITVTYKYQLPEWVYEVEKNEKTPWTTCCIHSHCRLFRVPADIQAPNQRHNFESNRQHRYIHL
ncbi:hypothetical protein [Thermococcus sp.]